MSKCQMKKFIAGGRCSGDQSRNCVKEDSQGIMNAFASLLASREVNIWENKEKINDKQNTQLVLSEEKIQKKSKELDIETILNGDI